METRNKGKKKLPTTDKVTSTKETQKAAFKHRRPCYDGGSTDHCADSLHEDSTEKKESTEEKRVIMTRSFGHRSTTATATATTTVTATATAKCNRAITESSHIRPEIHKRSDTLKSLPSTQRSPITRSSLQMRMSQGTLVEDVKWKTCSVGQLTESLMAPATSSNTSCDALNLDEKDTRKSVRQRATAQTQHQRKAAKRDSNKQGNGHQCRHVKPNTRMIRDCLKVENTSAAASAATTGATAAATAASTTTAATTDTAASTTSGARTAATAAATAVTSASTTTVATTATAAARAAASVVVPYIHGIICPTIPVRPNDESSRGLDCRSVMDKPRVLWRTYRQKRETIIDQKYETCRTMSTRGPSVGALREDCPSRHLSCHVTSYGGNQWTGTQCQPGGNQRTTNMGNVPTTSLDAETPGPAVRADPAEAEIQSDPLAVVEPVSNTVVDVSGTEWEEPTSCVISLQELDSNQEPKCVQELDSSTVRIKEPDTSTVRKTEPDSSTVRVKEPDSSTERVKEPDSSTVRVTEPDSSTVRVKELDSSTVRVKEPDSTTVRFKGSDTSTVRVKEPDSSTVRFKGSDTSTVRVKESDTSTVRVKESNSSTVRKTEPDSSIIMVEKVDSSTIMEEGPNISFRTSGQVGSSYEVGITPPCAYLADLIKTQGALSKVAATMSSTTDIPSLQGTTEDPGNTTPRATHHPTTCLHGGDQTATSVVGLLVQYISDDTADNLPMLNTSGHPWIESPGDDEDANNVVDVKGHVLDDLECSFGLDDLDDKDEDANNVLDVKDICDDGDDDDLHFDDGMIFERSFGLDDLDDKDEDDGGSGDDIDVFTDYCEMVIRKNLSEIGQLTVPALPHVHTGARPGRTADQVGRTHIPTVGESHNVNHYDVLEMSPACRIDTHQEQAILTKAADILPPWVDSGYTSFDIWSDVEDNLHCCSPDYMHFHTLGEEWCSSDVDNMLVGNRTCDWQPDDFQVLGAADPSYVLPVELPLNPVFQTPTKPDDRRVLQHNNLGVAGSGSSSADFCRSDELCSCGNVEPCRSRGGETCSGESSDTDSSLSLSNLYSPDSAEGSIGWDDNLSGSSHTKQQEPLNKSIGETSLLSDLMVDGEEELDGHFSGEEPSMSFLSVMTPSISLSRTMTRDWDVGRLFEVDDVFTFQPAQELLEECPSGLGDSLFNHSQFVSNGHFRRGSGYEADVESHDVIPKEVQRHSRRRQLNFFSNEQTQYGGSFLGSAGSSKLPSTAAHVRSSDSNPVANSRPFTQSLRQRSSTNRRKADDSTLEAGDLTDTSVQNTLNFFLTLKSPLKSRKEAEDGNSSS